MKVSYFDLNHPIEDDKSRAVSHSQRAALFLYLVYQFWNLSLAWSHLGGFNTVKTPVRRTPDTTTFSIKIVLLWELLMQVGNLFGEIIIDDLFCFWGNLLVLFFCQNFMIQSLFYFFHPNVFCGREECSLKYSPINAKPAWTAVPKGHLAFSQQVDEWGIFFREILVEIWAKYSEQLQRDHNSLLFFPVPLLLQLTNQSEGWSSLCLMIFSGSVLNSSFYKLLLVFQR